MNARLPVALSHAVSAELLARLKPLLNGPTSEEATAFATSTLREIRDVPPDVCDEDLIECLMTIAHYFYLASRHATALEGASDGLGRARRLGKKSVLRKALNVTGLMQAETGDLPSATEAYAEALQIARCIQDEEQQAPVWNNLGLALMISSQLGDALKCFERAASLASKSVVYVSAQIPALCNAALCALHMRDFETGIQAIRRAIEVNANPVSATDCFFRATAESNYARLLLEVGEIRRAQQHADLAQHYVAMAPTKRAEYIGSLTSGLLDVHSGRVEAGLSRLAEALDHARKSAPTDVRDTLSVCIAAHETAGQPDVALVYLHELLALNRETRAEQLQMQQQLLSTGIALSGGASSETALISDTARLQRAIDAKLQHLTSSAMSAALAVGHDLYRVFRVSRLAQLFAQSENWSAEQVRDIALAAKLADIGMIAIPEPLLTKPRGLSAAERRILDDHARFGAELLTGAKLALLQHCIPVARFHHEKWDGSGAWSLAGEAIPLEARLVALCDAFDAMTHPRPWRPQPLSAATALREISDQAGRQFDPNLAPRFVKFVQREFWKHDNFSDFLGEEAQSNDYVRARLQIARMMSGNDEVQP